MEFKFFKIEKIMKTQNRFFKKINIKKPLVRLIRKKMERTQSDISHERGFISADSTDTKRITKEYFEQLYAMNFVT